MSDFYSSNKELPFNSTFAYLERMERRWEDCDQAKAAGDTTAYFRALETIFRNAHPFFSDEEVSECEVFVKKIENLLSASGDRGFKSAGLWVGENQCDRFRMLLVKLLFKYKITYAKKERLKLEEEIEDDY